jgi:S-DNA-T family DNA segregation ATPase FtsK/SpoIIIE
VFFFIANLPWFIQAVYEDEHDMKGFMETIFRKGEGHKIYFFAALGPDDKSKAAGYEAFNLFTGYRDGIHLGGNVAQDPYLSFEYMSYTDRMKLEAPGIGLLPDTDYVRVTDRVVLPMAPKGKRRQEDDSD